MMKKTLVYFAASIVLSVSQTAGAQEALRSNANPKSVEGPSQHGDKQPMNKVALLIDASSSIESYRTEVFSHATGYLINLVNQRAKSQKKGADTFIYIISIDSVPEVLFTGSIAEFGKTGPLPILNRLSARKGDFACTDLVSAFNIAAELTDGDPDYVRQEIIAYTDMKHGPPGRTVGKCKNTKELIPAEFPWDSLKGASVKVLFVPAEQKYVWRRMADKLGFKSMLLYTPNESIHLTIEPPPPPRISAELRKKQVEQARQKLSPVWWGLKIFFGFAVLILAIIAVRLIFGRRQTPKPSSL